MCIRDRHWTDTQLTIDWAEVPDVVVELSDAINDLYWKSIDRPKIAHWLAAYDLVAGTLTPHPASKWAVRDLALEGLPRELTDAVMDDEFPPVSYTHLDVYKRQGIAWVAPGSNGAVKAWVGGRVGGASAAGG